MNRFKGRVALVTGAARGLGREIASAFAEEGASVVVCDVSEERLAGTAAEIREATGQIVVAYTCDVSSLSDVQATVAQAETEAGPIDHLVNNAGIATFGPFIEVSEEDWRRVMDVNVTGVFFCTQAVLASMLARRSGTIVNLASLAGKRPSRYLSHYSISKAAVISLTQNVAFEVAPHVRVNCVCPGVVNTEMQVEEYAVFGQLTGKSQEELQNEWTASIPMGRFQSPRDIAEAILFLSSDAAAQITGEALNVSGGLVMD